MDSTFIYIILIIIAVSILWAAYELYQIRVEAEIVSHEYNQAEMRRMARDFPDQPEPTLFDQEKP